MCPRTRASGSLPIVNYVLRFSCLIISSFLQNLLFFFKKVSASIISLLYVEMNWRNAASYGFIVGVGFDTSPPIHYAAA